MCLRPPGVNRSLLPYRREAPRVWLLRPPPPPHHRRRVDPRTTAALSCRTSARPQMSRPDKTNAKSRPPVSDTKHCPPARPPAPRSGEQLPPASPTPHRAGDPLSAMYVLAAIVLMVGGLVVAALMLVPSDWRELFASDEGAYVPGNGQAFEPLGQVSMLAEPAGVRELE